MPLQIVRGDIAKMETDAVVNAANSSLAPGAGVCGALFAAAGYQQLAAACAAIGHCPVGSAVYTPGFELGAKYIIHAVGPVWRGGTGGEEYLLTGAYTSALDLAVQLECQSVSLPLISTGVYGYPRRAALQVAMNAITAFLLQHEMQVVLVIYDKDSFALSEQLLGSVRQYIDDNYVQQQTRAMPRPDRRQAIELQLAQQYRAVQDCAAPTAAPLAKPKTTAPNTGIKELLAAPLSSKESADRTANTDLGQLLETLDEGFSATLLRLIDQSGMTDVQAYKRANIDRKLFSKIRSNPAYSPSKSTVLAFAVALRLDLDATRDLLARAGFALSHASKGDVIVEYFIRSGQYDIHSINEVLFAFDQRLLGA